MGLFRVSMKGVEIGARILQADGVDIWLENQGKAFFEKWLTDRGKLFFATRRGKSAFLDVFRKPLDSEPFREAINKTYEDFKEIAGEICETVQYAGGFNTEAIFLLPTFLIHDVGFSRFKEKSLDWAEFKRQYPTDMLKEFFYKEWRVAVAELVREELQKNHSVKLKGRYSIVAADDEMHWSDNTKKGAYYVFYGSNTEPPKPHAPLIEKKIKECNLKKGELTQAGLDDNTNAFKEIESRIQSMRSWHDLHMHFIGARQKLTLVSS